jgi:hypothetical protein
VSASGRFAGGGFEKNGPIARIERAAKSYALLSQVVGFALLEVIQEAECPNERPACRGGGQPVADYSSDALPHSNHH